MTNKKSTAKPSKPRKARPKKEPEEPKWLLDNIAEASKNARKIYFLFVAFLIYCGLTVIGTSDRQIILNETVNLPIIKIDVPLNGFFILAPVIAIFVFIYLQLYLTMRKDLINNLKVDFPDIAREHLYPWMLIVLDYPKKGLTGRLQSAIVKLSVWGLVPLILIIISTWFVKKHDPILGYIIGLFPIFGTIIILWFWFKYEDAKFKIRQILRFILNNLGKIVLIFIMIIFEIFLLFYIIPNANNGFYLARKEWEAKLVWEPGKKFKTAEMIKQTARKNIMQFFCVDLSYQILAKKPEEDYEGYPWLDFDGIHLEGANLSASILKRANLQRAYLFFTKMLYANLQDANLQDAVLQKAILFNANLMGANLKSADLSEAVLVGADLCGANLYLADIQYADFRRAKNLSENMLRGTLNRALAFYDDEILKALKLPSDHSERVKKKDFSGYNFFDTDLIGPNFKDAILRGANFAGISLYGADLGGADLRIADLRGADLRGVKNLTYEQLADVKTLYEAKLNPRLEKQIKEKYPHLLEEPKTEEEEKEKEE